MAENLTKEQLCLTGEDKFVGIKVKVQLQVERKLYAILSKKDIKFRRVEKLGDLAEIEILLKYDELDQLFYVGAQLQQEW